MFNIGSVLIEQEKLAEAKTYYQKIVDIKPDFDYTYYALGIIEEKEQNYPKAIEYYQKFISSTKDKDKQKSVSKKIEGLEKTIKSQELSKQQEQTQTKPEEQQKVTVPDTKKNIEEPIHEELSTPPSTTEFLE